MVDGSGSSANAAPLLEVVVPVAGAPAGVVEGADGCSAAAPLLEVEVAALPERLVEVCLLLFSMVVMSLALRQGDDRRA